MTAPEPAAPAGPGDGAGDGGGPLRVLAAAVPVGLVAGVGGALLVVLLHAVQHLAFGYTEDSFLVGVERATRSRRLVAVSLGGVLVALAWWCHRRLLPRPVTVAEAVRTDGPRMRAGSVVSDAVLQIVAVGAGASLGREGAPREVGAVVAEGLAARLGLAEADRRLLLAAGAGAGFAAVYDVPVAGAVFALEALLVTARPRALAVSAIASLAATVVSRTCLGDQPSYQLPDLHLTWALVVACLVVGPACALGGLAFRRAMVRARAQAAAGWRILLAIPLVFAALGVLAAPLPEVLGNGKALAQTVFDTHPTLGVALALVVAKPVATWLCLRAGATGGLLTPAFATGAATGELLAEVAERVGGSTLPGIQPAALALLGAAAFLAVAQRMPLCAGVLALELTGLGLPIVLPVVLVVLVAWLTARTVSRRARRGGGT